MTEPLNFQDMILRLHHYWAAKGCLIWNPYNVQVGAGTMNPATVLRVLGPEPWNVGYVEPSVRPDDSRYGENPNRLQQHTQYQVILKPAPEDSQELYLDSLAAIGIDRQRHDIRFVEDNWQSPALGAWGLGWEVWLDGLEITQFTYFQQAGGFVLNPVSVELTYGLERIAMFLQGVDHFKNILYAPGIPFGEVFGIAEYEHSRYNLDDADIEAQAEMFKLYEAEAQRCIDLNLVLPAHDFVLKCSHTFNVLDARGAIGVTERAKYFARMRALTRQVSQGFLDQRLRQEYPLLDESAVVAAPPAPSVQAQSFAAEPRDFVLEIGVEELPPGDATSAIAQLQATVPPLLDELRLEHGPIHVYGTPRRLTVLVQGLAPRQSDQEELVKGPPARVAFDQDGLPTRAAQGFARGRGINVNSLEVREMDGGSYAVGVVRQEGQPAGQVLAQELSALVAGISFGKNMRWNASGVAFSRPIRWFLALLGEQVVPFEYAGLISGRNTRGLRPDGSPVIEIQSAENYLSALAQANVTLDQEVRRAAIVAQIETLAAQVQVPVSGGKVPVSGGKVPVSGGKGHVPDNPALLEEVTYLVEQPTALLGRFEDQYLSLPRDLLVSVMGKHQRYFPVAQENGKLLPYFITIRNGGKAHLNTVRHGNQEVVRARFADAEFFYKADTQHKLEDFLPRLSTLTFQEELGSMLDKTERLERTVPKLCETLGLAEQETRIAQRAAHLSKADLVTQMVMDFTSLQGIMGREYARLSGEPEDVALAIFEHYLPRSAGDEAPGTRPGLVLGLANRLDSLAGLFAVGLAPTGSADPYQLRRDALGLIYNLIAQQQPLSVYQGLALAAEAMPVAVSEDSLDKTVAFVRERLRGVLREGGASFDVVDAVLSEKLGDDPYRAHVAVEQLSAWVARDDWPQTLAAYSRCARILRSQPQGLVPQAPDPDGFVEADTLALHAAYQKVGEQVTSESSVDEFLNAFLPLVEPITIFFDNVLVMAEDEALRLNRLALLQRITELSVGIVDLGKLQGF